MVKVGRFIGSQNQQPSTSRDNCRIPLEGRVRESSQGPFRFTQTTGVHYWTSIRPNLGRRQIGGVLDRAWLCDIILT